MKPLLVTLIAVVGLLAGTSAAGYLRPSGVATHMVVTSVDAHTAGVATGLARNLAASGTHLATTTMTRIATVWPPPPTSGPPADGGLTGPAASTPPEPTATTGGHAFAGAGPGRAGGYFAAASFWNAGAGDAVVDANSAS